MLPAHEACPGQAHPPWVMGNGHLLSVLHHSWVLTYVLSVDQRLSSGGHSFSLDQPPAGCCHSVALGEGVPLGALSFFLLEAPDPPPSQSGRP